MKSNVKPPMMVPVETGIQSKGILLRLSGAGVRSLIFGFGILLVIGALSSLFDWLGNMWWPASHRVLEHRTLIAVGSVLVATLVTFALPSIILEFILRSGSKEIQKSILADYMDAVEADQSSEHHVVDLKKVGESSSPHIERGIH